MRTPEEEAKEREGTGLRGANSWGSRWGMGTCSPGTLVLQPLLPSLPKPGRPGWWVEVGLRDASLGARLCFKKFCVAKVKDHIYYV